MNILRLYDPAPRIEATMITRSRVLPTPALSDAMERHQGAPGLLPVGRCMDVLDGRSMAGTALTARTRPGDNLAVHKALDLARPGDVLVIDARGETENAILGELMCSYAATRSVAGIVVDGAIRDSAALSRGILPVFARGISHLGPYKSGPGEVHGPAQVGGIAVHDGDLVVGDADGVVLVPRARAETVLKAAEAIVAKEGGQARAIANGNWDRSWIDQAVRIARVGDSL